MLTKKLQSATGTSEVAPDTGSERIQYVVTAHTSGDKTLELPSNPTPGNTLFVSVHGRVTPESIEFTDSTGWELLSWGNYFSGTNQSRMFTIVYRRTVLENDSSTYTVKFYDALDGTTAAFAVILQEFSGVGELLESYDNWDDMESTSRAEYTPKTIGPTRATEGKVLTLGFAVIRLPDGFETLETNMSPLSDVVFTVPQSGCMGFAAWGTSDVDGTKSFTLDFSADDEFHNAVYGLLLVFRDATETLTGPVLRPYLALNAVRNYLATSYIVAFRHGTASFSSVPRHEVNDLFLLFAYRDGSATAPSLPSGQGWTSGTNGGNNNSFRYAYKIATSNTEGVGTFTNATSLFLLILRNTHPVEPISRITVGGNVSNTPTVPLPTAAGGFNSGIGKLINFIGHRTGNIPISDIFPYPAPFKGAGYVIDNTDSVWALSNRFPFFHSEFTSSVNKNVGANDGWRTGLFEITPPPIYSILSNTSHDDWAVFGANSTHLRVDKSGGGGLISSITTINGTGPLRFAGDSGAPSFVSWTGGDQISSDTDNPGVIFWNSTGGDGFEFSVPADLSLKRVTVKLGGFRTGVKVIATLSDNSAASYNSDVIEYNDLTNSRTSVIFDYRAASANQSLTFRAEKTSANSAGNLALQTITLESL
jgi:hypothetical protein